MASASAIEQVVLGRFVAGLAVGIATSMCTMYISECAPAKTRGKHSGLAPLSVTVGLLGSFVLSLFATNVVDGWRYMFAFAAVPALVQLGIILKTNALPSRRDGWQKIVASAKPRRYSTASDSPMWTCTSSH